MCIRHNNLKYVTFWLRNYEIKRVFPQSWRRVHIACTLIFCKGNLPILTNNYYHLNFFLSDGVSLVVGKYIIEPTLLLCIFSLSLNLSTASIRFDKQTSGVVSGIIHLINNSQKDSKTNYFIMTKWQPIY